MNFEEAANRAVELKKSGQCNCAQLFAGLEYIIPHACDIVGDYDGLQSVAIIERIFAYGFKICAQIDGRQLIAVPERMVPY